MPQTLEREVKIPEFTPAEIRKIREKSGLSVRVISRLVGSSYRAWYEWEAGTAKPSGAARILIAQLRDGKL